MEQNDRYSEPEAVRIPGVRPRSRWYCGDWQSVGRKHIIPLFVAFWFMCFSDDWILFWFQQNVVKFYLAFRESFYAIVPIKIFHLNPLPHLGYDGNWAVSEQRQTDNQSFAPATTIVCKLFRTCIWLEFQSTVNIWERTVFGGYIQGTMQLCHFGIISIYIQWEINSNYYCTKNEMPPNY